MKRHLPAFFAASNASMAPPGAKICSSSLHVVHAVHLPEIHVVRLHRFEREVQFLFGFLLCPFPALGGEEDIFPERRDGIAVNLFGVAVGITVRHVEVIDPQIIRAANHRNALLHRDQMEPGASHTDAGELDPGPAQGAHGDVANLGLGGPGGGRAADAGKCSPEKSSSSHTLFYPARLRQRADHAAWHVKIGP